MTKEKLFEDVKFMKVPVYAIRESKEKLYEVEQNLADVSFILRKKVRRITPANIIFDIQEKIENAKYKLRDAIMSL
ncbi:MAG: hypothetical protein ACE5KE_14535 [Methanosarcinales archaeon]